LSGSCLAIGLALLTTWWAWQQRGGRQLIDIDRAEPLLVETKIDINRADWPELALMPEIGEQLARRIVADREEHGPFRDLADLQRVRGIGPRTLERMRPYLLPVPNLETTAEGKAADSRGGAVN
jgi:competence protein ComEA